VDGYYVRDYAEIANASVSTPWWSLTFDLVIKLGVVIGLIYLTMWVLKTYVLGGQARKWLGRQLAGGRVALLDTTQLAPGRTLYLVEVADRVLVLGATGSSLSTLAEIREAEAIDLLKARQAEEAGPPSFAAQLKSLTEHLPVGSGAAPSFLADKIGELRALAMNMRRPAEAAD
jgi:flagellar biogenesis protein FliO